MRFLHSLSPIREIAKHMPFFALQLATNVWHFLVVLVEWFVARPYFTLAVGVVLLVSWKARKTVVVISPFHVPTKDQFPFTGEIVTGCLLHTLSMMRDQARGSGTVRAIRPYGEGRVDQDLFYLPPQATIFQSPPQFSVEVKGISYEGVISTMRKALNKERILSGDVLIDREIMVLLAQGNGIRACEADAVPITSDGLKKACRQLAQQIVSDLDPDLLGVVLAREEQYAGALEAFQKGVERAPNAPEAYRNLGTALAALGRYDEALESYEKALNLGRKHQEIILYAMGDALFESHRVEKAQEKYEAAIKVNPEYLRALNGKGIAQATQEHLDAALVTFQEIIKLNPKFASAYSNKGGVLHQQKKLDEALLVYQDALKLLPNDPLIHTGIANVLSEKGELAAAIEHYRAVLDARPGLAFVHMRLGQALHRNKADLDEVLIEYRQGVRFEPGNPYYRRLLGEALEIKGNITEAIVEYREAVRMNPNNGFYHTVLGDALKKSGNPEEAFAEYREAVRVEPDDAYCHRVLGHALKEQSKLDEALVQYREAVRLEPANGSWHFWLADILETRSDMDGALQEFREAVRLQPVDAYNRFRLGDLLKERGDLQGAISEFREAVRLKPDDAFYQSKLNEVTTKVVDASGKH